MKTFKQFIKESFGTSSSVNLDNVLISLKSILMKKGYEFSSFTGDEDCHDVFIDKNAFDTKSAIALYNELKSGKMIDSCELQDNNSFNINVGNGYFFISVNNSGSDVEELFYTITQEGLIEDDVDQYMLDLASTL